MVIQDSVIIVLEENILLDLNLVYSWYIFWKGYCKGDISYFKGFDLPKPTTFSCFHFLILSLVSHSLPLSLFLSLPFHSQRNPSQSAFVHNSFVSLCLTLILTNLYIQHYHFSILTIAACLSTVVDFCPSWKHFGSDSRITFSSNSFSCPFRPSHEILIFLLPFHHHHHL